MRYLIPFFIVFVAACTPEATRIRLVNATAFNLEDAELSFGGEAERIRFLAAGDESNYFRFDGADDCNRLFSGELQSFGSVMSAPDSCMVPRPIAIGEYSLVLSFEPVTNPDGTTSNAVFLRLRED